MLCRLQHGRCDAKTITADNSSKAQLENGSIDWHDMVSSVSTIAPYLLLSLLPTFFAHIFPNKLVCQTIGNTKEGVAR